MPKNKATKSVWDPEVAVEQNHYNWFGEPVFSKARTTPAKTEMGMIDLFSGCGGFSVGFRMAGFVPLLAVDIHKPSLDTYAENHPEAATFLGDIRKISPEQIKATLGKNKVAVVVAGVPCQGFSLCNRKRHDNDARNFLFEEFIRIVKFFKPPFVLLENVSGMKSAAGGKFVEDIEAAIEELGYSVDHRMLSALEHGVPQKRERLFFFGALPGYEIRWPVPTYGPGKKPYRTVSDAIGDLPPLGNAEEVTKYKVSPKAEYQVLMRDSGGVLTNHEAPNHPDETIEKIRNTKPGEPMYPKFKQRIRLSLHDPSPTQVSGGIRPQFSFGHPTQPRGLSVRERCRIQSFPDSFHVHGGIVQGRVQTGNAVPPLLAKAVATKIAEALKHDRKADNYLPKKPRQMVFKTQTGVPLESAGD